MGDLSRRYVISVMFQDQVGIVAEVSAAVRHLGGNLLDVSQTVLRGYFSMILLGEFPEGTSTEDVQKSLQGINALQGACFGVMPFQEELEKPSRNDEDSDTYILTASGPDQPGLVAMLSEYLKERKINIVDLSCCQAHTGEYTMIWQIQIPAELDVQKLQNSMRLAFQPKVTVGLRHQALFKVTNEI